MTTGLPVTRRLDAAYVGSLIVGLGVVVVSGIGLASSTAHGDTSLVLVSRGADAPISLSCCRSCSARCGSPGRGLLIGLLFWPGALFYVLYAYVPYLVGAPFSELFFGDVLLVTLSAFTIIGILVSLDMPEISRRLAAEPARTVGGESSSSRSWRTPGWPARPPSRSEIRQARWPLVRSPSPTGPSGPPPCSLAGCSLAAPAAWLCHRPGRAPCVGSRGHGVRTAASSTTWAVPYADGRHRRAPRHRRSASPSSPSLCAGRTLGQPRLDPSQPRPAAGRAKADRQERPVMNVLIVYAASSARRSAWPGSSAPRWRRGVASRWWPPKRACTDRQGD